MESESDILRLPTEFSLGRVIVYGSDRGSPAAIMNAQGDVRVPCHAQLYLDVSQDVCNDLRRIRLVPERLRANGLSFVKKNLSGADFRELARLRLRSLTISFCNGVHVEQLWQLGGTASLEHLSLAHSPVSCADYSWLLHFRLVRTLLLDGTGAGDACLQALPELEHLEDLGVGYSALTGDGFRAVWGIPTLNRVSLSKTSVDNRVLDGIGACSLLSGLRLDETAVSDDGVGTLVREVLRGGLSLRVLGLRSCPITDRALVYLSSLRSLGVLDLHGTAVTQQGVSFLREVLASCRVLF